MRVSIVYLLVLLVMFMEPLSSFISKHLISKIDVVATFFLWSVFGLFWSLLIIIFQGKLGRMVPLLKGNMTNVLCIILFACLGWSMWFLALKFETVVVVNTVISSYVVFSLILSCFVLREKFSRFEWLGVFFTLLGVLILIYQPLSQSLGVLFGVLNALFYSIQYMFVKKAVGSVDPFVLSTVRMCGIALFSVSTVSIVGVDLQYLLDLNVLLTAFGGALIAVVIGLLIYVILQHMDYGRLSVLKLWQPAILIVLSLGIFHESVTLREWLGIFVMCIGGFIMSARKNMIVTSRT